MLCNAQANIKLQTEPRVKNVFQVLHYEDPYRCEETSTSMVSHQVQYQKDPNKAEDLAQKEVVVKPVDIAYGVKDDVPDLVQKKVAIQPAPLLQETALPPPQKQEEGQALTATDVCQKPEMGEFPIPLQAKPDDCQDQLAQQSLPQPPLQEQGRQDLTAIEDRQEPEIERSIIPQSPPHVQEPEDFRPLHNGAESPPPPEVEVGNQEGSIH